MRKRLNISAITSDVAAMKSRMVDSLIAGAFSPSWIGRITMEQTQETPELAEEKRIQAIIDRSVLFMELKPMREYLERTRAIKADSLPSAKRP